MLKTTVVFLLTLHAICLKAKLTDYSHYYSAQTLKALEEIEESPDSFLKALHQNISYQKPLSYKTARQYLFGQLHLRKDKNGEYSVEDVYCSKTFGESDGVGEMKIPNHHKVNCEHTWPRSRFNHRYQREYQLSDLHHLFPSDSRANSSRSNIEFGEGVKKGDGTQGCFYSYRVDSENEVSRFQVQTEHRGNVARALFYFSVRYKLEIDDVEEAFLRKWHNEDPVDNEERSRNNQIESIQYNRNPFIDEPELVERITDF